jgi:hypothetical protein
MQLHEITKAEFHGSLALRKRRPCPRPDARKGYDIEVVYRHGVATLRSLTGAGRHFVSPMRDVRAFDHAAAFLLARVARDKGLRVRIIGEPSSRATAGACSDEEMA